jgi:hypothetical protein
MPLKKNKWWQPSNKENVTNAAPIWSQGQVLIEFISLLVSFSWAL